MLPPEHQIARLNKKCPCLWQDIDECRAKHSKSWPGWCFIRRDELADIIDSYQSTPSNDDHLIPDLAASLPGPPPFPPPKTPCEPISIRLT